MKHPHLCVAALLLLLASCAAKPNVRVVLLEDDNGKTGAVSVFNSQGTRIVDKSGFPGPGLDPFGAFNLS